MTTIVSVHRGCAGGYVGPGHVHPALLDEARGALADAKRDGAIIDSFVARCGDDIGLVLLADSDGHDLAREAFDRAHAAGVQLAQHGLNGSSVAIDSAVMTLDARSSEPLVCCFSDKSEPGTFNRHLFRAFGDPFNSPSLLDARAAAGFGFEVAGLTYQMPGDLHDLLRAVRDPGQVISAVRSGGQLVAVASDGSDPAMIVRCEAPYPTVGEVLETFASLDEMFWPTAAVMPVSSHDDAVTRAGAPGRVIGLGFQVAEDRLVGPRDVLGDRAFDDVRRHALLV